MKKNNIFWISYSDLMTSLFFVTLVLFVVTIGNLNYNLQATKDQLKKIKELETAVQELPKEYFVYQPLYKRYNLKKQIQFDKGSSDIKPKYNKYLVNVGDAIVVLINKLKNNRKFNNMNIKYLVIIEGMASKDSYARNFQLSYERALALYNLWRNNGIDFDAKFCEIQISGSGTEGIREYTGAQEFKNQQFLIQIIPKMGNFQ